MVPRADISDERRGQILDTAEDVFAKHGFDGTTIDDIAQRAGLSKGAVYWYFKKKDDLIAGLLDRVFRRSVEALRGIASEGGTVRDRLLCSGEQISRDYQSLSRLMPIALEFYGIALRRRSVRKHLAKLYDELLSIFTPLIEEGIRSGELAATDARAAATMLIAGYEGLGIVWSLSPKLVDWKSEGPRMAATLYSGLAKR
jgi:AcrR family transcriptional regulator